MSAESNWPDWYKRYREQYKAYLKKHNATPEQIEKALSASPETKETPEP